MFRPFSIIQFFYSTILLLLFFSIMLADMYFDWQYYDCIVSLLKAVHSEDCHSLAGKVKRDILAISSTYCARTSTYMFCARKSTNEFASMIDSQKNRRIMV